ncbi:MmgE/PrpD family protein [Brevibacillus sp. SYP-B805]|uniref:MmgE/PrpD family protein n=1 Tax=Brevibacillus sp. SYP-B805 TaxID=1578199 RepID=UPI0013ED68CC|nr:MmgE/PrpD family protein [Brevibacillus sp. SYP-B805]NGQ94969.1 MmgE/PrpD family protein [Brevibacillus sp. SYP-B805]
MIRYILGESIERCDESIVRSLKEALADVIACTIAGCQTEVARIVKTFAVQQWARGKSSLFLSTHALQAAGATFVNATMANALDLDDGHRLVKGHPGAVVFPAVLAAAEERETTGKAFLTALLIAYEVAIRAGMLAHQLRPEYHCTGSWGAIGAAAGVGRILGLSVEQLRHALGIAEYHATYSPMMRCIDHPSMLKDGIAWGSMTGISSAYLAQQGFTGIPSLFGTKEAAELVEEMGMLYRIQQLYFKPHACCRWAQPAVEGAKYLAERHRLSHREIGKIVIRTFRESARLSKKAPANTEEAQYNLYFPVAAYLVFGEVGPRQVLRELANEEILSLMSRMETQIDCQLDAAFPEKALSQVELCTYDGRRYLSPVMQAKGDYDFPLTGEEKKAKFFRLTEPFLGRAGSEELFERIQQVDQLANIRQLTAAIARNLSD